MSEESRHHDSAPPPAPPPPPPGADEVDALLREWHTNNAQRAAAGREQLMARLRAGASPQAGLDLPPLIDDEFEDELETQDAPKRGPVVVVLRRIMMDRTWTAAAAALLLAAILPFLMMNRGGQPGGRVATSPLDGTAALKRVAYEGYLMAPDAGRLDAVDPDGNLLGPCELTHTDVRADVSGFLTRVTVTQKYHNPHAIKIEARYTFPLSERSAVDRMTMTIGNRVIEGQVKERAEARRIYEQARAEGRVASLLEQERPNIFTQSIANIEPGASVDITISYVEITRQVDGLYQFDFPTTIGPRYTPGSPVTSDIRPIPDLPTQLQPRRGLVLLAPATISDLRLGDTTAGTLTDASISEMLRRAHPVHAASPTATIWSTFRAAYPDGSAEYGTIYTDFSGTINGRGFWIPPHARPGSLQPGAAKGPGAPFAADTDRVPDASRVSPMPAKPGTRPGSEISITVNIDTGGPALGAITSRLHEVNTNALASRATVTLSRGADIPNRDFVLTWRQETRQVEPSVFTYTGPQGNFFCVQLLPPPVRSDDEADSVAVPREMTFVLDTSGSMKGRPIETAKKVLDKALDTLRPRDSFNIIMFANDLRQIWPAPRPATRENIAAARSYYALVPGNGGTEIVNAVSAALSPRNAPARPAALSALELANLPADGRRVIVDVTGAQLAQLRDDGARRVIRVAPDVEIDIATSAGLPVSGRGDTAGEVCRMNGRWETINARRVLTVESASIEPRAIAADAFRLVVFLTDGLVSNENEVLGLIDAVKKHGRQVAVFPFAIGKSPNRYLLESMARYGRGEVDFVYEDSDADQAVARFDRRIRTPILTNITAEFSPNLNVLDVLSPLGGGADVVGGIDSIPDLFDLKPLTIVGRYNQPGAGTLRISGLSADGPYERIINLTLPSPAFDAARGPGAQAPAAPNPHDTIATLWARAKVESVIGMDLQGAQQNNIRPDLRSQIISLGESFNLVTPYTSFVAVDRLRVTIGGQPRLIHIPVELHEGADPTGFFGADPAWKTDDDDLALVGSLGASLTAYRFAPAVGGDAPGKDGASVRLLVLAEDRLDALSDERVSARSIESADQAGASKEADKRPAVEELRSNRTLDTKLRSRAPESAKPVADPAAPASPGRKAGAEGKPELPRDRATPAPASVSPAQNPPPPPSPEPALEKSAAPAGRPAAPAEGAPRDAATFKQAVPAIEMRREAVSDKGLTRGLTDFPTDWPARSFSRGDHQFGEGVQPDAFFGYITNTPEVAAGVSLATVDPVHAENAASVLALFYSAGLPDPRTSHAADSAEAPARQRVVLLEHVVLRVRDLLDAGKGDEASVMALALVEAVPGTAAAAELKHAFAGEGITPEDRARIVGEQATLARARLDALVRDARLRRVLEQPLLELARTPGLPPELVKAFDGPLPEGIALHDGGVLVTLRVAKADGAMAAALGKTGMKVIATDEQTRVIVGVVPLGKVADAALVEGVERVERTKG